MREGEGYFFREKKYHFFEKTIWHLSQCFLALFVNAYSKMRRLYEMHLHSTYLHSHSQRPTSQAGWGSTWLPPPKKMRVKKIMKQSKKKFPKRSSTNFFTQLALLGHISH